MSTGVGIVGGLSIDHLVSEPASAARFNRLGGPGLYAALGARLVPGARVRLLANLPASTPAFRRVLTDAGVDLTACPTVPDVPRVWLLTSTRGRRLVPVEPPAGSEFATDDDVDEAPVPAPDPRFFGGLAGVLYCAPSHLGRGPTRLLTAVDPDQRRVRDLGEEYWHAMVADPGVLLPSRVQLAGVAAEPRAAARLLARRHDVKVAARLDAEGIYAVEPAGAEWLIQDGRVEVVDTTGAGDTSAGAILAALAAGADLPTAAALGISAARLVLAGWGHDALLDADAISTPFDGVQISRQ